MQWFFSFLVASSCAQMLTQNHFIAPNLYIIFTIFHPKPCIQWNGWDALTFESYIDELGTQTCPDWSSSLLLSIWVIPLIISLVEWISFEFHNTSEVFFYAFGFFFQHFFHFSSSFFPKLSSTFLLILCDWVEISNHLSCVL
jgi:hypothetical protein